MQKSQDPIYVAVNCDTLSRKRKLNSRNDFVGCHPVHEGENNFAEMENDQPSDQNNNSNDNVEVDQSPDPNKSQSQGSDYKPESQEVKRDRHKHLNQLLDLNDQPRVLDHNFRLTRPLTALSNAGGKRNKVLQCISNSIAAVINTTSEVKTGHINIWNAVKDGPYMDNRLQVPGFETPDKSLISYHLSSILRLYKKNI